MNDVSTVRGGPPRVHRRTGCAISLSDACSAARVPLEVGMLGIRRMRLFALRDDAIGWMVSPVSIEILMELGAQRAEVET